MHRRAPLTSLTAECRSGKGGRTLFRPRLDLVNTPLASPSDRLTASRRRLRVRNTVACGLPLNDLGRNNVSPSLHGFHIHEFGDLRAEDGTSAGGHYNPCGTPHAGPDQEKRHVGDLGNVEADENGIAAVKKTIRGASLHFLFGRSLVVHAGADDLHSQPSGNAGPRVALGVVGIAK